MFRFEESSAALGRTIGAKSKRTIDTQVILVFIRINGKDYIPKQETKSIKQTRNVSISISVIPKGQVSAFGNGFAPVKIFNAIPSQPFSAALNCAPQHPSLLLYPLFPCLHSTRIPWQSRAQYSIADNMGTSHLGTPYITELVS